MIKIMCKCKECEFNNNWNYRRGYRCEHENIFESAKHYEIKKGKKIKASKNFIPQALKTSLRWCPLK